MGGTFNPIHIGHLLLAETARDACFLDEILFIPSGHSYMKDKVEMADKYMRFAMTSLAIENNPYFKLSAIEVERQGNTYTFETLLSLRENEPETAFYFIMGADSLFHLESWKNPEIIFASCTILAAVRDEKGQSAMEEQIAYLEKKYAARIELLPLKEFSISSTDIRKKRKLGHSIRYMVPEQVMAYIEEHHLYQ